MSRLRDGLGTENGKRLRYTREGHALIIPRRNSDSLAERYNERLYRGLMFRRPSLRACFITGRGGGKLEDLIIKEHLD